MKPTRAKELRLKMKWAIDAPAKKIRRVVFLVKRGWSTTRRVRRRLGVSPRTINQYFVSPSRTDTLGSARCRASTLSCPKKQKLIIIQQRPKEMIWLQLLAENNWSREILFFSRLVS
jgi:hypothetical protein